MQTTMNPLFKDEVGVASLESLAKQLVLMSGAIAPTWSLPAELQELAEDDSNILPSLVSLFLSDSTARFRDLSAACVRQDFKTVRAQAHSLKGTAHQMGAAGLASQYAALELSDSPEPGEWEPTVRAIDAIDREFVLVRGEMEEYLLNAEGVQPQARSHALPAR